MLGILGSDAPAPSIGGRGCLLVFATIFVSVDSEVAVSSYVGISAVGEEWIFLPSRFPMDFNFGCRLCFAQIFKQSTGLRDHFGDREEGSALRRQLFETTNSLNVSGNPFHPLELLLVVVSRVLETLGFEGECQLVS